MTEAPRKASALEKEQRPSKAGEVPNPEEPAQEQSGDMRRRRREAIQTMEHFRYSEITRVHKSLARLCAADSKRWELWKRMEWTKAFGALAILFWGGFIAGWLAIIPFLDLHPHHAAKREYEAAVILSGVFAFLFTLFRVILKEKEIESVQRVYDYVDEIVKSYEEEPRQP